MTANQQLTDVDIDQELWRHFVQAEQSFLSARTRLTTSPSAVALIRAGLARPSERSAALDAAALLPTDKKRDLFGDVLALASFVHGGIGAARAIILSLPHDWLLANIEQYAEPLLAYEDDEEYRRLLELYSLIDRDLTLKLARRAAEHADPDIKEAGEDFLANPDPFRASAS
jgi:hypothetical protein